MTIEQIKNAGIITNKWDTLQDVCSSFLFTNEGYLYVSPKTIQYYFEEETNLVFVRYTRPNLSLTPFVDDYTEINLKVGESLKKYYVKFIEGGANDSKIGRYHSVFDVAQISAIL